MVPGDIEAVRGGRVRRIRFEEIPAYDLPPAEPTPEEEEQVLTMSGPEDPEIVIERVKEYRPRHQATIDEIHFEVDHISSSRASQLTPYAPRQRSELLRSLPARDEVLYSTRYGSVHASAEPYGPGSRRGLYVSDASVLTKRRFKSSDVDALIAGVDLETEEIIEETVTEYVPASQAGKKHWTPVAGKRAKKAKPDKPPKPAKAKRTKQERKLRPQCAALTEEGAQCRNSARLGSKYCGSHKGYQPKGVAASTAARDTRPAAKVAEDTAPATAGRSGQEARPQCAALTAAGKQCRNSARDGSKYCGSHKGYRPTPAAKKALDTKPRVKDAPDTKPAVRRRQLFQRKKQ